MGPSHLEPDRSQGPSERPAWSQGQFSGRVQTQQSSRNFRSEDSWVEIPSAPSAASIASYPSSDEIVTTGLQVRRDGATQSRQLRLSGLPGRPVALQRVSSQASTNGSSQDEYDESESDSDRVLSSSNEDVANISGADEEDDTHTALGVGHMNMNMNIFTPQPHAFSQPATARTGSIPHQESYFPPAQPPLSSSYRIPSNRVPTIQRPPIAERRSTSNIQPDHDAALRASLTALLEFAPATRKDPQPQPQQVSRPSHAHPTTLRLISGTQLNAETTQRAAKKRRSRESSKERQAKKLRPVKPVSVSDELTIAPTMMTWFISAGFVLVLSAISFSAGYAWGKEVGRVEGQMGIEGASCGREVMRGSRTGLGRVGLSSVRA